MADDLKFTDNSDLIMNATKKQVNQALTVIGSNVSDMAKSLIHSSEYVKLSTGRLKNSLTFYVQDAFDNDKCVVHVGSNVEYAVYVEEGTGIYYAGGRTIPWVYKDYKGEWHRTSGMQPQHYLRTACQREQAKYPEILKQYLKG
jgi:hypothetical protein